MTEHYRFWLEALRTWTMRQREPITDFLVQYEGDGAPVPDPQWTVWRRPGASRRVLQAEVVVPWDQAALQFDVSGETLLLIDGQPVYGINPYHRRFRLQQSAGTWVMMTLEQVTTGLMGTRADNPGIRAVDWVDQDLAVERCYWDLAVLLEWADNADVPSDIQRKLSRRLDVAFRSFYARSLDERAVRAFAMRPQRSAEEEGLYRALQEGTVEGLGEIPPEELELLVANLQHHLTAIYEELKSSLPAGLGELVMMGHAHIDLAWLWPIAETRRKIVRTAASQVALLAQYPNWRFGMSSPEMWRVLEDQHDLWARWQALVQAGRVEPLGAFWVESDSQMIGGESVLRHLLYGIRYFETQVGVRPITAFLPDTFGYSGALPTLLHAAGIRLFLTTKINWNDTNRFPYHHFRWQGPDGASIQAMIFGASAGGYNGRAYVADLKQAWSRYVQAQGQERVLYAFGWGDGGGGPDESMLERIDRYQKLPLLPKLTHAPLDSLLVPIGQEDYLPRYRGDLYLEYHRAVFTAQTMVKTRSRAMEADLISTEAWAVLAGLNPLFQELWTRFLRNHFHDILPGSSIHEVYQDFQDDLTGIQEQLASSRQASLQTLLPSGKHSVLVVGHRTRFARPSGTVLVLRDSPFRLFWGGAWHQAHRSGAEQYQVDVPELPSWGLAAFPLEDQEDAGLAPEQMIPEDGVYHWHTGSLTVSIAKEGIRSLQHHGRELLRETAGISAFFQHPDEFDAWEMVDPAKRGAVQWTHDPLVVEWQSPYSSTLRLTHHLGPSCVVERIELIRGEERIALTVTAELRERHLTLQYRVPTTLISDHARRETLWGVDEVPTVPAGPVDEARFEWAAHRFIDLSEPHQGLALINDGRYGHFVDGSDLSVTLAFTPLFPDPGADQRPSPVRLALVSHDGHWSDAGIMAQAHALSEPPLIMQTEAAIEKEVQWTPIVGLPANVALLALKLAEDGSGDWVYHLGEMWGDDIRFSVQWPRLMHRAALVDLVDEEPSSTLRVQDGKRTALHLGPHALAVVRVSPQHVDSEGVQP